MSFQVARNLELVHFVAQDPLYDRERDEFDELDAYYDEHEDCFAEDVEAGEPTRAQQRVGGRRADDDRTTKGADPASAHEWVGQ